MNVNNFSRALICALLVMCSRVVAMGADVVSDLHKKIIANGEALRQLKSGEYCGQIDTFEKAVDAYEKFVSLQKERDTLRRAMFSHVKARMKYDMQTGEWKLVESSPLISFYFHYNENSAIEELFFKEFFLHAIKHIGEFPKSKLYADAIEKTAEAIRDASYIERTALAEKLLKLFKKPLPDPHCQFCGISTLPENQKFLRCARCGQVYYCSYDCQKKDWNHHKATCKPTEKYIKQQKAKRAEFRFD